MGYRSEVAIMLREKDYERLLKKAKSVKADYGVFLEEAYENGTEQGEALEDYVCLYWENEKWFEDYEEIRLVMDFIRKLKDYHFLRIGSDNTDIEQVCKTKSPMFEVTATIEFLY